MIRICQPIDLKNLVINDKYLNNHDYKKIKLNNYNSNLYMITFEGQLAGYCKLNIKDVQTKPRPDDIEIEQFYLSPEFRNLGLHSQAMRLFDRIAMEKDKKVIWTKVNKNNFNAIRFYNRFGFHSTKNIRILKSKKIEKEILIKKLL